MEKSFNTWRGPESDAESGSDSDVVEDLASKSNILALDSDEDDSFSDKELSPLAGTEHHNETSNRSTVSSSSVEGCDSSFELNSTKQNSLIVTTDSNINSESSIDASKHSSPEQIKPILKIKKGRCPIIESDDEEEINTVKKKDSLTVLSDKEEKSTNENVCDKTDNDSSFIPFSPTISNHSSRDHSLSSDKHKTNSWSFESDSSEIRGVKSTFKENTMPVIDLTGNLPKSRMSVLKDNCSSQQNYERSRPHVIDDNTIEITDSESADDQVVNKAESRFGQEIQNDLSDQLISMKISPSMNKEKSNRSTNDIKKENNDINDYVSRNESLMAEEFKLKKLISQILKEIENTKASLNSANLSALPDRGVRLQMQLKSQQAKLRDLRYQQSTLANEIVKLQITLSKPPSLQPKQPMGQKMFKLPTFETDFNAMGKRAMETHRTQQALTVDALRALHNSLKNCPNEDTLAADPKGLRVELMPHQKHGLAWLLWREKEKPSGGILADDMGLGKTLTMISLVLKSEEKQDENEGDNEAEDEKNSSWTSSARPKLIEGNTLVVCPATLLGQWEGEVQNKVKRGLLDVVVHHGQNREKRSRRLAKPDIVITTYNILSRDASSPDQMSPLFQIKWKRVILDEAHQIRNYKTKTAQAVFQLKAKSRWALTGTPVHNKEIDLYALLKFLRCSPFDDLAVWKRWVDNRDAAGVQRLTTITKSIMLRRTKHGLQEKGELSSLTSKTFHKIDIVLDKEEQKTYEKLLIFSKTLFGQFLHQKAEKENALTGIQVATSSRYLHNEANPFEKHPELARLHRQMKEIPDVKSHDILVLLLRLRQFCCHPALIHAMLEKEDISNVGIEDVDGLDIDLMDKLTRMSLNLQEEGGLNVAETVVSDTLSVTNPLFAPDRLSSKIRRVLFTLDEVLKTEEDKVIVVSQWVSLLNLVHGVLKERKIKCAVLTGAVPVKDRAEIVQKFNRKGHSPRVMLLSLTAGGVGLNLIGGNHLLLLDLHWNPQLESQACDRIYRVGQEKNVHIYKFVSAETIEERILKLQEHKLSIADGILTGAKHTSKLSLDDLKMLFQMTK